MEFINVFDNLLNKCSSSQIGDVAFVINEFAKVVKNENDSMKLHQLNFLLTYSKEENFLVKIYDSHKKKYNMIYCLNKVMDTFEKDLISPMLFTYFLYCISKAINLEVRDFEWINPTLNTLDNESMNLETIFGCGCYLEQLSDYVIEGNVLQRIITNRKYLTVPHGVSSIDRSAFDDITNLHFVTIPESVTKLTEGNFNNKVSVQKVILSNKIKVIPDDFFKNAQNISFVFGRGVKEIGANAFESTRLTALKNLSGFRIEKLGDYAFRDCFSLKKLHLPYLQSSGIAPFYNCMNITELLIDVNLKMIDNKVKIFNLFETDSTDLSNYSYFNTIIVNAKDGIIPDAFFENCTSISSIKINGNITKVGANAFKGCTSLTNLELNFVGDTLSDGMFEGCISLEKFPKFNTVEHIGMNTFKGCTKFDNAIFPKPILSLAEGSFRDCNILRTMKMNLSAKELPAYSFSGCTELIDLRFLNDICVFRSFCLKDIVLPTNFSFNNEIEYIEANAFDSCSFANKITIPSKCTIDKLAFSNIPVISTLICNNLEIKDINNDNVELFELFESDKQLFLFKFSKLKNITIDTDVIGVNSFNKWHQIETITLSPKVSVIEYAAFEECVNLKELVLSDTLITIKENAFKNCNALVNINTPKQLSSEVGCYDLSTCIVIEENAFQNCNCIDLYLEVQEDSSINKISLGSVFKKDFKTNLTLTNITVKALGDTLPDGLFDGCNTAKNIKINGSISKLSNNLFKGCSSIESLDVDFIGNVITNGCFENCNNLKTLPNFTKVDTIEACAFRNCSSLVTISIENNVTFLGESAFEGCSKLTTLDLELHVKALKANSFKDCVSVTDYFFIKEVEVFESYSLANLNLVNKFIPPHNAKRVMANAISGSTFSGELVLRDDIIYEKKSFDDVKGLNKITFKNALFTEDEGVFLPFNLFASSLDEFNKKFSNINSIVIDTNAIVENAFMGWRNLVNVELTDKVKKLPQSCFENCNLIHSIKFPYYNISLSNNVFANCSTLSKVEYNDNFIEGNVTEVPKNVFKNCKKITDVTVYLDQFILDSNINFYSYFDESESSFNKHFAKLRVVNVVNKIDSIPSGFFRNCKKVDRVTFINPVNNFGKEVFMNCHSLTDINVNFKGNELSDSLFANCIKLNTLFDYSTVDTIGIKSFSGCKKLIRLDFANKVKVIKERAFENCVSLTNINLEFIGNKLDSEVFLNCKKLAESPKLLNLENIDKSIFNGCKKLKTIHISGFTNIIMKDLLANNKIVNSIHFYGDTIPNNFFSNFNNNTQLHFHEGIKIIGNNAFENCLILKELTQLDSIEEIGLEAFKNSGLVNITIPERIKDFSAGLFSGCASLVSIDVPVRFDFIGSLFSEVETAKSKKLIHKSFSTERVFYLPESLKTIKINSGEVLEGSFSNLDLELIINVKLNRIKDYAFYNCSNVTLPYISDIRQVGDHAFAHTNIDELNLSSVTTIGHSAFKECTVKNIVIGNKISEIHSSSFFGFKFDDFKIEKNIFYKFETNILIDVKKTMILNVFDCEFDLVIPSEIQTLESNTFDSINIKNINTNNVRTIKSNAFSNCLTLETVKMPKVEKFGQNIFLNCVKLNNLETSFMGVDKFTPKYLDYFFDTPPASLSKVVVNGGTITMNAFRNIDLIEELDLLNVKQEVFEENTFRNIKINTFIMPKQINDIVDSAFVNVEINDVKCDSNNNVRFENNIIIVNDKMIYCTVANNPSVVIDDTIKYISKTVFKLCDSIENVELINKELSYLELFDGIRGIKKITTANISDSIAAVFKRNINEVEEIVYIDKEINPHFFKGINSFNKLVFKQLDAFKLEVLTNPLTALKTKKILINTLIFENELKVIEETIFDFIQVENCSMINSELYSLLENVLYNHSTNTLIYAFKNVSGNITVFDGMKTIRNEAFKDCANLVSVILNDVEVLNDNAFENCTSLSSVIINKDCTKIGKTILRNCNNFKLIEIPFIGENKTKNTNLTYLFGKDIFDISIKEFKLTNQEVINQTFSGFDHINKIILCNATTTIEPKSFENCTKLSELYLSPSVTTLPEYVFIGSPKSMKVIVDKDIFKDLNPNIFKFGDDKKDGGVKVAAKKMKPEFFA